MAYDIGGASGAGKKLDLDLDIGLNSSAGRKKYLQDYTNRKLQGTQTAGALAGIGMGVANAGSASGSGSGGSSGNPTGVSIDDEDGSVLGSSVGFDYAAYLKELQRQAQERANQAYQRNMERIANAYNSAAGNAKSNYNSTVDRLNAARDKSMGEVRGDAEDSLRQAYINNMLTKKDMNQRLSAMGYNGGATESTMASLANNYGSSRTGINETLNKNLSNLDATYGDNLASALQSYNSAISNLDLQRMQLEMQAENARQNAEASALSANMGIDSSYMSALQAALANQSNYTYDASKATNDYVAGNAQQAASADQGSNYSKYLAQAQLAASQGNNKSAIAKSLYSAVANGDLDINSLYSILNQLGVA